MNTWQTLLGAEKERDYFRQIIHTINQQRQQGQIIYPADKDVFNAFRYSEFQHIKVVILGQDPYHGAGQAHGLAFSVQKDRAIPPSLRNIYKELATDISGFTIPQHGYLKQWADQGVLLLNTVLTVQAGLAHSHRDLGWEIFTDFVIEQLNQQQDHLVFLLWGSPAQKKGAKINRQKHLVLSAPHPSPLSAYRGFFGCKHFSLANSYLASHGIDEINWQID